jgi:hypothetical protein
MAKGGEIKASRHHRRDPGSIAATFRESLNVRFETGKMSAAHRALIDPVDNFDRGSSAPPHIIGIADDLRSQNRETGCFQIRHRFLILCLSRCQPAKPCAHALRASTNPTHCFHQAAPDRSSSNHVEMKLRLPAHVPSTGSRAAMAQRKGKPWSLRQDEKLPLNCIGNRLAATCHHLQQMTLN